ncbi:hypothetical protein ABZ958_31935 [Streptomyces sp. NPDC046237]|uniref:hypothetical protein n=1 Tax=Streptomyces sp. NPDC046237 TaxID=3154914 RepID=UPI00340664AB
MFPVKDGSPAQAAVADEGCGFAYKGKEEPEVTEDHWDLIAVDSPAADCGRRVSVRCRRRDWLWWA